MAARRDVYDPAEDLLEEGGRTYNLQGAAPRQYTVQRPNTGPYQRTVPCNQNIANQMTTNRLLAGMASIESKIDTLHVEMKNLKAMIPMIRTGHESGERREKPAWEYQANK